MGDFDAPIERYAEKYSLPPALVKALVQVESNGNPWAVRYEPAFYDRYVAGRRVKVRAPCSRDTEMSLLAHSFGLLQIMGLTARETGFDGVFLTELCDPETNLDVCCKYLSKQVARFHKDHGWEGVAASYNAGSVRRTPDGQFANQGYVNKVRKAGGFG